MIPGVEPISANSLPFIAMSLGLIAVAWSRYRKHFPAALGAVSLVLLASWLTPRDLVALALFLVPPYLLIRRIWGKEHYVSWWVASLVIGWEVLLFVYLRKYEWTGGFEWLQHPIAIIGLSYMLFRIIHLVVEAPYLGHLSFGPVRYLTYTAAFWTLLSGPIQKYDAFCAGLETIGRPDDGDALAAAHRLVNGLIKAFVLAPLFLPAADIGALAATDANWLDFAIVLYAYPVYLYLNFSGYTDAVIASASLCGMKTMPENFNRPYLARNLLDFWSRWHMSFGVWIRQYVFNPLSKNLLRMGPRSLENVLLAVGVIITFVIVGAWHGTTSNFILFGLLHGTGIVIIGLYGGLLKSFLGRKARKAFLEHRAARVCSTLLCFHFVCATILLFPNRVGALETAYGAFFRTQGWL